MKLAIYYHRHRQDHRSVVEKMCQAQCLQDDHTYQVYATPAGAIGCVHTSDRLSAVPHLFTPSSGNILAVSGVPLRMQGSIAASLQAISLMPYQQAAKALAQLDGAYAAVFWDQAQKKLLIVTDFLGNQPLYQVQDPETFLLATDLQGLAASGLLQTELDPVGWGAFLSLGYFVGKHTSLKKVEIVDSGSLIVYDPLDNKSTHERYWRWHEPQPQMTLAQVDTGELVDQLEQHARACLEHNPQGTLLLSGGFDSRLLLCVLHRLGVESRVVIHDHPDENNNADGRYARQIAQRFNIQAEILSPTEAFFSSSAYLDFLIMNEITTPSLNLFIAQLASHLKKLRQLESSNAAADRSANHALQAIWEGVGPGNSLYPCIQTSGGFDHYLRLITPQRNSVVWRAAENIFAPRLVKEMDQSVQAILDQERKKYADDEFGVREFIMDSRVRHRAVLNPLKIYANHVLPFTPGLSKDFLNAVNRMPFRLKINLDVYLKIFRNHFPQALTVPWCSGGVLIDAHGHIHPVHRLYMKLEELGWLDAIKRNALLDAFARKLGRQPAKPQRNALVEKIISQVDLQHPDLHTPGILRLRSDQLPSAIDRQARAMLFYWQAWQWLMTGRSTTLRQQGVA